MSKISLKKRSKPSSFGKYLAQVLEENNTSQAELAKCIGTTRQVIFGLIKGNNLPSLRTLQKIAGAMGCKVEISITSEDDDENDF